MVGRALFRGIGIGRVGVHRVRIHGVGVHRIRIHRVGVHGLIGHRLFNNRFIGSGFLGLLARCHRHADGDGSRTDQEFAHSPLPVAGVHPLSRSLDEMKPA